jgi:hypothetical protein
MRRCYFVQEMDGDDGGHVASVGKVFKVEQLLYVGGCILFQLERLLEAHA